MHGVRTWLGYWTKWYGRGRIWRALASVAPLEVMVILVASAVVVRKALVSVAVLVAIRARVLTLAETAPAVTAVARVSAV